MGRYAPASPMRHHWREYLNYLLFHNVFKKYRALQSHRRNATKSSLEVN